MTITHEATIILFCIVLCCIILYYILYYSSPDFRSADFETKVVFVRFNSFFKTKNPTCDKQH